jgi:hypothetical protein
MSLFLHENSSRPKFAVAKKGKSVWKSLPERMFEHDEISQAFLRYKQIETIGYPFSASIDI